MPEDKKEVIADLLLKTADLSKEEILNLLEKPRYSNLGDMSFPCFTLASKYKKSPFLIAQEIASAFDIPPKGFSKVQAIGGYVNFFFDEGSIIKDIVHDVLSKKGKYGQSTKKRRIAIEFSQANTHKAFHVGHIRGTSLGECLARIFEFSGNKVIRANYEGDTGMHVAKWIWCYTKYHDHEKLKKDESWIASIYVEAVKLLKENESFQAEVDEINRKLEEGKDKKLMGLWKKTRKLSLDAFEKIYKELGTHFDKYYFESQVEKSGKAIALELLDKHISKIDQGANIMDLKDHGLGVWLLLRKDGTVLYSAKDLALALEKFKKLHVDESLIVVGAAQQLHFQQLSKTLEIMHFPHAQDYKFLTFSEVRLPTGKMSSRTGDNILYSDFKQELVDQAKLEIMKRLEDIPKKEIDKRALMIAIGAMKYSMLKQDPNKNIVFEKEKALNFEGDSGPYLQYSYARASSIIRKSKSVPKLPSLFYDLNPKEAELAKKLSEFPEVVSQAYSHLNSSLIANYSFQLAQLFNEFYHACPVLNADKEVKQRRLAMVEAFRIVLKSSLYLLGIPVMEQM